MTSDMAICASNPHFLQAYHTPYLGYGCMTDPYDCAVSIFNLQAEQARQRQKKRNNIYIIGGSLTALAAAILFYLKGNANLSLFQRTWNGFLNCKTIVINWIKNFKLQSVTDFIKIGWQRLLNVFH